MSKRQYYTLCLEQPLSWLVLCATTPSKAMTPMHVALVKLAIRNKL